MQVVSIKGRYEIAEPADSAVTCSGSKCCSVNSSFVSACASLTKIRPVTMIAMREVMKNGLHHGQNCPRSYPMKYHLGAGYALNLCEAAHYIGRESVSG